MEAMTAGVTPSGEGIQGISWNILGQTYVPMQHCESSFSWHATFPPGTFVPPHIHPDQDEFIYMLNGRFDLFLDGADASAIEATLRDVVKLRGVVESVPPGSLPNDGKVIDDVRKFD